MTQLRVFKLHESANLLGLAASHNTNQVHVGAETFFYLTGHEDGQCTAGPQLLGQDQRCEFVPLLLLAPVLHSGVSSISLGSIRSCLSWTILSLHGCAQNPMSTFAWAVSLL